jgi:hypothetical protein
MLNPEFSEMLSSLNAEGVEYLIVGAFALSAHGIPRATGDIDIWVRCSKENAQRLIRALRQFGAPLSDVTEIDFEQPGTGLHIGVPPCRVDILSEISGVTFDDAWRNRFSTRMDQYPVNVIGLEALLTNKRAAGRPKDRVDATWIEKKLKRSSK